MKHRIIPGDQMHKKTRYILACLLSLMLLILILDSKTALIGAEIGIKICLKTLIPSLFPFLVLSSACCELLFDLRSKVLSRLLLPCKLPEGAQAIFLLGALGGYPVGARLVSDAYSRKALSKTEAQHMLMFCSNAGPAFIFGVVGQMFSEQWISWAIWLVHIASAYIVGALTAREASNSRIELQAKRFQFSRTIETMGLICGWVILFKILLTFLDKWFLNTRPALLRIVITGALELSNGCLLLPQLDNAGLRFLVSLALISLGGSCIIMQTASLIGNLPLKKYLYGKLLQTMISLLIAFPLQALLLFDPFQNWVPPFLFTVLLTVILLNKQFFKKTVAFPKKMIYNTEKA